MAGSGATVLLPSVLYEPDKHELEEFIRRIAGSREGDTFWIAGQPFSIYQAELEEDLAELSPEGWVPQQAIGICAGCRGSAGDLFLAMLVTRVAEMFGGLVAFGGSIESFTSDPSVLTLEGRYTSESGDLLTPGFMYYWVGHPQFRMCN